MHHEKMQHMIVLLEKEARGFGYEYSADFLKIAANSLEREAALANDTASGQHSFLESVPTVQ